MVNGLLDLKSAIYLSKFMSWFSKKKMNEQDINNEESTDEILDENGEKIPVFDKRNFNSQGERMNAEDDAPRQDVKSMRETELENKLKEETARREAAEAKLVGVQTKFEEVKTEMERETQEMRERMRKTLEDRAKQGQFSFLTTLLPVLDNLNLAIDHAEKDSSLELLLGGVKGTARSFEQALLSVGVEPIQSTGTEFNPELHEAVDMVAVEPENDGRITAEYSRGYKFGDRLLRPARVQVGKAMAQTAGE
jgi:molecular chaperone GrpE